ncbi:hypothetical protein SAMN02745196_02957 [Clostridium collagenovorans DSM 3089]|uniref:Uncharacterized protein n=1 Tax=Clostridium collagenovorans DSM 3089 TaxID=1121306 RepID=A0A1M5YI44_9CLOT|nr:hypothetical protein [Clostridium collagenovorans]SHI11602.1 hypothetical protein SAMN02745196_02957 [Clostridium collagenovorans DSM 3089]
MENTVEKDMVIRELQEKIHIIRGEFAQTDAIVKSMMDDDKTSDEIRERFNFQRCKLEGLRKQLGDLERKLVAERNR